MTPEIHQRRVARVLALSLGVMLAALAGYLLYIQVCSSDTLSALASKQQHMCIPLLPQRGPILDSRLRTLAASVETPSVFADPKVVREPSDAAAQLGHGFSASSKARQHVLKLCQFHL